MIAQHLANVMPEVLALVLVSFAIERLTSDLTARFVDLVKEKHQVQSHKLYFYSIGNIYVKLSIQVALIKCFNRGYTKIPAKSKMLYFTLSGNCI